MWIYNDTMLIYNAQLDNNRSYNVHIQPYHAMPNSMITINQLPTTNNQHGCVQGKRIKPDQPTL